jgi:hypothetical protein
MTTFKDVPTAQRTHTRARQHDGSGYTPEELEALRAVDQWKRANRKHWPALTEIMAILRSLGWRKVQSS